MAVKKVDTDLDFSGVGKLIRALMNPLASDPGSPAIGEVWYNTADDRLKVNTGAGVVSIATLADVTGGAITGALWNAQSVVVAVADDTPVPQVLAASTVLGRRATGDITAVSYANLLSDLEALGITADALSTQIAVAGISDFTTEVNALVDAGVAALIDSAPGALDTLNEIAAALQDDPDVITDILTSLSTKTSKYAANIGDGAETEFVVNHALASTDVVVSVRLNSTGEEIVCSVEHTDANNITVEFNTVYASNAIRVVVIG